MIDWIGDKILGIFETIVQWMFDSLIEPFLGITTLKDLVFGREGKLVWGTFYPKELSDGLNPIFYSMVTLTGFLIVALIVVNGMRISAAPLNPMHRTSLIEFVKDLLLVGILLVNLPTFYDLLFLINDAIVGLFAGAYDSNLDEINKGPNGQGLFGYMFVRLVLIGLMVWANFYYMMRKVTLLILMGIGPITLGLWLHPRFKVITTTWLKELTGTIFVQSIHALTYWIIAVVSITANSFVATVIVYVVFIPVSEQLRRLFGMGGDMQGVLSKTGAMFGMSGLAGMYGAVRGALENKSVMGAIREGYHGLKKGKGQSSRGESAVGVDDTKSTLVARAGADDGTTPTGERMLKSGEIFSKAGKAVFGMAGSVAGSPLGPVGAIMGATSGSAIGGVVGGVTGRTGMSALQAIATRHRKGKMSAVNGGIGKNNFGFEENLANEIADRETASWAEQNKDAVMADLRSRFPDATEKELERRFNDEMANKREGFYQNAKTAFNTAKKDAKGMASGKQLIASSANAMANQWAKDNMGDFFKKYDQENPQMPGESRDDYLVRRMNAFNQKKDEMKNLFAQKGHEVASSLGYDLNEPISKKSFSKDLADAIQTIPGVKNVTSLANAGMEAINHVQGASVIGKNGKPNTLFLASRLANVKTNEMKKQFIKDQVANGMSQDEAETKWNAKLPDVHRENLRMYQGSIQAASQKTLSTGLSGVMQKVADAGVRGAQYLGSATGLVGAVQSLGTLKNALASGSITGYASFSNVTNGGKANVLTHFTGLKTAAVDGFKGAMSYISEKSGGAVQAQAKYQNAIGYTAGLFLGKGAYQGAKNFASKFTPFGQQVQQEIQSPSEIIQMAQTTIDANGNEVIAPGAIRQVTTAQESYIEVRTKSGTTQIVSRKGAGHSGLKKGDVVYQDLTVEDGSLVVVKPRNGESSTYRLDSGGAKIPSSVQIVSNPNNLLGNPLRSVLHAPVKRKYVPSYNQHVDNGQFYVEDLQSSGMENVRVIVERDRQYVVADKDNMTYRVSPYYEGDVRLSRHEEIQIPVTIQNNRLVPTYVDDSTYGVKSSHGNYYSTNLHLLESKAVMRVKRALSKRQELEQVRRKQGL